MSTGNLEMSESSYSSCLDICILWGRYYLLENNISTIKSLEEKWDQFAQKNNKVEQDIHAGLKRLLKDKEEAIALLNSDATLNLDPEDAFLVSAFQNWKSEDLSENGKAIVYQKLNYAFTTLDNLVYLGVAANFFPKIANYSKIREHIEDIVDDLFLDKQLHLLRFIPINAFRNQRIDYFSQDDRYLFPWYTEWNDLPPETLDVLAEIAAGWPQSAELSEDNLFALHSKLREDPRLLNRIRDDAERMRMAFLALDEAHALRGLLAADDVAGNLEMPDKVVTAGMIGAACRVAVRAILNKTETNFWKFRAGLCGLGLSDEERLSLMKPVENEIRESKRERRPANGIAWKISSFPSDGAMAKSLFSDWIKNLEYEAKNGFMPLPEARNESLYRKLLFGPNPEKIAILLQSLDALRLSSIANMLKKIFASTEKLSSLFYEPVTERGTVDDRQANQGQQEITETSFFLLPLPKAPENKEATDCFLLREEETAGLRNALKDTGLFYWGGLAITKSDEEYIKPKMAFSPIIRIDKKDYNLFILGISLDEEILKTALEKPETLEKMLSEDEMKTKGINWILYIKI